MGSQAKYTKFEELQFTPRPTHGDMMQHSRVVTPSDGIQMISGFARFTNAAFETKPKSDEVLFVLAGSINAKIDDQDFALNPHDCILIPGGATVYFRTEFALLAYAALPFSD